MKDFFKDKIKNDNALLAFGFKKHGRHFEYKTFLSNEQFELFVTVSKDKVSAKLSDTDTNEEYFLHLAEGVEGTFVGQIKSEYEKIMTEIAEKCFDSNVFTSENTLKIINYAKIKYADELEFLWEKSPDCAVLRRKDTQKWYAIIMKVSLKKFGINDDKIVEIINFRVNPNETEKIIDKRVYFPAYHMNKRSWISLYLENLKNIKELEQRIDESYLLAVK